MLKVDGGWSVDVRRPPEPAPGPSRDLHGDRRRSPTSTCASSAPAPPGRPRPSPLREAGASVLLIDRLPFLGGTSTAVLDTFYGFYTPGSSARKVVGGIGDDVVAALRELGPVVERPNTYGAGTGVTYLAEHLKVVVGAARDRTPAHGRSSTRSSRRPRSAMGGSRRSSSRRGPASRACARRAFVDASGDADLCAFAGFGYETAGDVDPAQTLTTTFRMANVDLERRRAITKAEFHR